MPVFAKEKEQMVKPTDSSTVSTVIGEGANFNGELTSAGSIQVDGLFEGTIKIDGCVYVGEKGRIKANITASEVVINGEVNGNIDAQERLEIQSKGRLFGDITTKRLSIAEGVVFEGHCTMNRERSQRPQQAPGAAPGNAQAAEKQQPGAPTQRKFM